MLDFSDTKFKEDCKRLEMAERNNERIEIETSGMDKWQADLLALCALTSDADVRLVHEGKTVPTLKQVINNVTTSNKH